MICKVLKYNRVNWISIEENWEKIIQKLLFKT